MKKTSVTRVFFIALAFILIVAAVSLVVSLVTGNKQESSTNVTTTSYIQITTEEDTSEPVQEQIKRVFTHSYTTKYHEGVKHLIQTSPFRGSEILIYGNSVYKINEFDEKDEVMIYNLSKEYGLNNFTILGSDLCYYKVSEKEGDLKYQTYVFLQQDNEIWMLVFKGTSLISATAICKDATSSFQDVEYYDHNNNEKYYLKCSAAALERTVWYVSDSGIIKQIDVLDNADNPQLDTVESYDICEGTYIKVSYSNSKARILFPESEKFPDSYVSKGKETWYGENMM